VLLKYNKRQVKIMPGPITHYICGEAVVNEIDAEIKTIIQNNRQLYNVGTQGPDIYFYYLPGFLNRDIAGIGSKMHEGGVKNFISNLLDEAKGATEYEKKALTSYLCGYISHYALDCNTHPYIYYRSGFKTHNKKGGRVKFGLFHVKFETEIDEIFLKMFCQNTNITKKDISKKIGQITKISKEECFFTVNAIGKSVSKSYNLNMTGSQVYKSFLYINRFNEIINHTNNNSEEIIIAQSLKISSREEEIIKNIYNKNNVDFFNIKKDVWYTPWNEEKEYRLTFCEMYQNAIIDSIKIINVVYKYLYTSKATKQEVLDVLGNKSFASGVDSEENITFYNHASVFYNKKK
jgi:hypothetical protein